MMPNTGNGCCTDRARPELVKDLCIVCDTGIAMKRANDEQPEKDLSQRIRDQVVANEQLDIRMMQAVEARGVKKLKIDKIHRIMDAVSTAG